ncbi:TIGR00297 family protein [Cyanothece sp. BG0011]|uniref:TIGR00297 family protein n=1 Tax=Cyanothece sp. BG0011 TaxID=2082950 RepID=UPI0018E575E8|nr:TIGR00297 family protein [Cyanothece sp. BG0011]
MMELYLSNSWIFGLIINSILITFAFIVPKKLLTVNGYLNAWLLGVIIWGTLGWQGYAVVMFYFLVGSGVTKIGMEQKEAAGIAEKRSGMRGPENVWGSALIATICALGTLFVDAHWTQLLLLGYVASFSTKLSDTTASEVGKAYGKRTFLITTLKPVSPGTEGAVSLEGTLAGMVASGVIALVGYLVGLISLTGILYCIVAAFIATNLESLIGATLQENLEWMTNEIVNIINTLIGAVVAIILAWFFLNFMAI